MKEKEFLPLVAERLDIQELNAMQRRMLEAGTQGRDIVLLSPTGSGKTLAFVLPVLKLLKPSSGRVQAVVIAPSRELVLQIAGIVKKIAVAHRCVAVYGGHKVEDEVNELSVVPDILVGTPGRMLDHAKRHNVELLPTRICVLDEFDKSLELGFEKEMAKIFGYMKNLNRIMLTSATAADELPAFISLKDPMTLDYLEENSRLDRRLDVYKVEAEGKDKLEDLLRLLKNLSSGKRLGKTIVFVNHRESAERTLRFLKQRGVSAVLYHGALDQREREKALALFRNGSRNVLVSTDLGARGLDITGVENVIHYHIPLTVQAYTHRNGRTARMDASGRVFVMLGPTEAPADYMELNKTYRMSDSEDVDLATGMESLYIGAGKKEKLSKGDILGWLTKECGIDGSSVGTIEVGDHYSLVALPQEDALRIGTPGGNRRIKGSGRRVETVR